MSKFAVFEADQIILARTLPPGLDRPRDAIQSIHYAIILAQKVNITATAVQGSWERDYVRL
ncbi:hypothetical protein PWG15_33325 (plasmid) [Ensifer adhaerens]|uniref:hypothetical protein n=1 Tax=Ensifer adhaerens TaxID=106592 RepID=UPI0023A99F57|nr:hypothetical protein [Ensifer adhaerens]WDZ81800.1 hypothetical protein PWG15_33325 [Ensifer adhaerens]